MRRSLFLLAVVSVLAGGLLMLGLTGTADAQGSCPMQSPTPNQTLPSPPVIFDWDPYSPGDPQGHQIVVTDVDEDEEVCNSGHIAIKEGTAYECDIPDPSNEHQVKVYAYVPGIKNCEFVRYPAP